MFSLSRICIDYIGLLITESIYINPDHWIVTPLPYILNTVAPQALSLALMTSCNPHFAHPCLVTLYPIPTDPPDGSPSCSVEPALNHTSLKLLCSWTGGFPSPSLHWTGDLKTLGHTEADTGTQTNQLTNTTVLLSTEGMASNDSSFSCMGSHLALTQSRVCSTRTCKGKQTVFLTALQTSQVSLKPLLFQHPAEPVCLAYVTNNKQYLMLSCSWDGGSPNALVWWEGPGDQGKVGKESSNVLVLRYGTARGGKPYTCHAKHPLLIQTKTCRLTLGQYQTHLTTRSR